MLRHVIFFCYWQRHALVAFLPCFSPKVTDEHQTTKMVIYNYNVLPINSLNCWYVISEAYKIQISTICRLSSLALVSSLTNDDD